MTWDLAPQPLVRWGENEAPGDAGLRVGGTARGAQLLCLSLICRVPGLRWELVGVGSWGPGTTQVPHPSDPESFPRFCPGLGLVPAPCQTARAVGRAPVPHTPWPGTGQKTGAPCGFRPECREARALSCLGRGGLPHAPQLGASPSWYQPGGFPCSGHAQGGKDVWEHV